MNPYTAVYTIGGIIFDTADGTDLDKMKREMNNRCLNNSTFHPDTHTAFIINESGKKVYQFNIDEHVGRGLH